MNKQLQELSEYQAADIALLRLKKDSNSFADSKRLEETRTEFNKAKSAFIEAEMRAETSVKNFGGFEKEYALLSDKLENLLLKTEKINKDTELEAHLKEIYAIKDRLYAIEREISFTINSGDKIVSTHKSAMAKGAKLRGEHSALKDKIEKITKEKAPVLVTAQKKAEELRKKVDPSLLARYDALMHEKKIPALAGTQTSDGGRTFSCNGCGIGISLASKAELVAKGFSKCDSCRRMIYK